MSYGEHECRDPLAELPAELAGPSVGLLDHVVQSTGSDHMVGGAGVVQQRSDLDRVKNERSPVDLSALTGVKAFSICERLLRLGKPSYQSRNAASSEHERRQSIQRRKFRGQLFHATPRIESGFCGFPVGIPQELVAALI